jgi:hypothetical protein
MKKILSLTLMVALAVLAIGCGGKKKNDDIITQKVEKQKPKAPIRMQPYTQNKDIQWAGGKYKVEITRTPDDSLAMVKDETGQQFVDNNIRLRIVRSDGSTFFSQSFTKATFGSYIDNDYRKTGILEGLVFVDVKGGVLEFAASVSHPQTDEYIPLLVTVSKQGTLSIRRDSQLDTSAQEHDSEEEDI